MLPRHLYVHVPFCGRRCTYCDFAIAVRKSVPSAAFVASIEREMDLRWGPENGDGRSGTAVPQPGTLETLYLGGGTPSKLGNVGVRAVIAAVRARWTLTSDAEVTIEANPEDVTAGDAAGWREAGVTRVSLGVQSFNDDVLQWMHRTHDSAQVATAARELVDAGFDDWSLDLIYALPPEVRRDWKDDLHRAIDLAPAHVSCYGLAVEPHTPLLRWRERGTVHEADEERYEAEFLAAHEDLETAGLGHYEVSNYARPGRRARHNSVYWRRVPYVGVGPSAHSFDGTQRRWNVREFAAWQEQVDSGGDPVAGAEVLNPEAVAIEEAYLGLRTSDGLDLAPGDETEVTRWERAGWARIDGDRVRLTPQGWLRLDALVAALTDFRSRY